MSKDPRQVELEIIAELGIRHAAGLKSHACSKVCGLLTRDRGGWAKAFEHISDHFRPMPEKESHALFARKYRSEDAIWKLIYNAASKPSELKLTKLTIAGEKIGRPAVEIVRNFGETIGEDPWHNRLRIFVDFQGNLITAYPGPGLQNG
jgi:hypothetical protein